MADGTLKVGTITTSSGSGTITIGQSGETLNVGTGVVSRLGKFESQLLHIQDQKSNGIDGGQFSAGNNDRPLNTVLTNEITGASLSSNQITLPSGTYYINVTCPTYFVQRSKISWYNVTDSSYTIVGLNNFGNAASSVNNNLSGRFTITSQKVFKVIQYTSLSSGVNDYGVDNASGQIEVYADLQIWRTGEWVAF